MSLQDNSPNKIARVATLFASTESHHNGRLRCDLQGKQTGTTFCKLPDLLQSVSQYVRQLQVN